VSYTWTELLGDEPTEADEPERTGVFGRLRESLAKSRRALTAELASAAFDPGDEAAWERLEEALIRSDVGVPATAELVRRLEARGVVGGLEDALVHEVEGIFGASADSQLAARPTVILVVGVNGTGKTTTIGKLRAEAPQSTTGRSSWAPHTERGRGEALEIWASAPGDFRRLAASADPAAVAFDAVEAARRVATTSRSSTPRAVSTHRRTSASSKRCGEVEALRRTARDAPRRGRDHGQNGLQQARLARRPR
jgi:fused signal recognition particle receptor